MKSPGIAGALRSNKSYFSPCHPYPRAANKRIWSLRFPLANGRHESRAAKGFLTVTIKVIKLLTIPCDYGQAARSSAPPSIFLLRARKVIGLPIR